MIIINAYYLQYSQNPLYSTTELPPSPTRRLKRNAFIRPSNSTDRSPTTEAGSQPGMHSVTLLAVMIVCIYMPTEEYEGLVAAMLPSYFGTTPSTTSCIPLNRLLPCVFASPCNSCVLFYGVLSVLCTCNLKRQSILRESGSSGLCRSQRSRMFRSPLKTLR